jgi:hypothetical protein
MNDIVFIKWLCKKAEGFEWIQKEKLSGKHAVNFNGLVYLIKDFEDEFKTNIYPLLLARAVEGINKEGQQIEDKYWIAIYGDCVSFEGFEIETKDWFIDKYKHIDQAKEAVLRYRYGQELE